MRSIVVLLILFLVSFGSNAQNEFSYFVGIHPAVTVEPFYEAGEFDVNIIPLVFQTPLSKRIDIRGTCYYTYHFGSSNGLADTGLEVTLPRFFRKKESKSEWSRGFYLAPSVGFGRNFLNEHNTLTVSAEPGYMFKFNNGFAVTLYGQIGGSHFNYSGPEPNEWKQHFGIKVNLGFWNPF